MILKPSMVIDGKKARKASVEEVAERTLRVLKRTVPPPVPGIAFLSGGQSTEEATAHLSAINASGDGLPGADLLLWPGTAGRGTAAWGGKAGECRRRPARLRPPCEDVQSCGKGNWKKEMEKAA